MRYGRNKVQLRLPSRQYTKQISVLRIGLLASAWAGASFSLANAIAQENSANASTPLAPSAIIQVPATSHYYSPYSFVVDKTSRTLTVWQEQASGRQKVATFPADMGKNTGDKRFSGDQKTPEGVYFLQEKLEGSTLDFSLYGKRAFTTDYPNFFDRIEGKTGYGIWLHAVPDEVPLTRGSRGCVVVRNQAILDLTQFVRLGRTPILIQAQSELAPLTRLQSVRKELNEWIESWRSAWETKNIDQYMDHYGQDFQALNMNFKQWRAFKARLNDQYKKISVRISQPAIYQDRDYVVARFLQEYTSDLHADFGEKVLYLKKAADKYRIIGETWSIESNQVAKDEIESTMPKSAQNQSTTASCDSSDGRCGNLNSFMTKASN